MVELNRKKSMSNNIYLGIMLISTNEGDINEQRRC